jgi:hypothetical protein
MNSKNECVLAQARVVKSAAKMHLALREKKKIARIKIVAFSPGVGDVNADIIGIAGQVQNEALSIAELAVICGNG